MKAYFKGNKNIVIDNASKRIEFQPYNLELTCQYIARWIPKLCKTLPDDYAIYLGSEFNHNGLLETNILLLKNGGNIGCNYTGNYRSIKQ